MHIYGPGLEKQAGSVSAPIEATAVNFESISFRAES
jgi:hypothetical protein